MGSKSNVFDSIVLVNVTNTVWSGYKRTTEEDLDKLNATLPGDGFITKGGKKIFPSEKFKPFNTLKKEVSRKIASLGTSVLGGSIKVIPQDKLDMVLNYLAAADKKYASILQEFVDEYDDSLEAHLDSIQNPKVREVVSRATLTKEEAVQRFRFKYDNFKVAPSGDGLGLIESFASSLFAEIAESADQIYEKSFKGKPRVACRALNQVFGLRNKLDGLNVLDENNISVIVSSMDEVLQKMPAYGWIEGVEFSALMGLVTMLKDPETMLEHAELIRQGKAYQEAINSNVEAVIAGSQTETELVTDSSQDAPVVMDVDVTELAVVESSAVVVEAEVSVVEKPLPITPPVNINSVKDKHAAFF